MFADVNCYDDNEQERDPSVQATNATVVSSKVAQETAVTCKNRGGQKKGSTIEAKVNLLSSKNARTTEVTEKYIETKRKAKEGRKKDTNIAKIDDRYRTKVQSSKRITCV